ncbi:SRPBCC family protein [Georgenia thermotolerans]|uniref:Uncharacterized protein n=1 Tax=Georgenia thermotolerans TaxID=527326 RepID=A0A7J5UV55_9MICO|nr:hypothetical protein [Georgenia thermotolerans]KAE8766150.1 hypothetical protein GB883_00500 [Georgenia thermotolerans]
MTVALINVAGNDGERNDVAGNNGEGKEATTFSGARIELLKTGTMPADPPPGVSYWFEGRVRELKPNQRVFVFGYFDNAAPTNPPSDALGAEEQAQPVSPPAQYFPGGSWRVDWTLEEPPGTTRFEAVLVEVPVSGDAGNPGGPATPSGGPTVSGPPPGETGSPTEPTSTASPAVPSPDDELSRTLRNRLLRTGPTNPLIVARDDVVVGSAESDSSQP